MQRKSINPAGSEWGLNYSMDQGETIEGTTRRLYCSGQVSLVTDTDAPYGYRTEHKGDIAGQIGAALANIDKLLDGAGMTRANIVFLRFYTTDMDGFLADYKVYADWIAPAGIRPTQTLLGLTRLADPDLMVEIEAVAEA